MKNNNGTDKTEFIKLLIFSLILSFSLFGCGGSGGDGGGDADTYSLSGILSGLGSDTVDIRNNQDTPITLSEDGTYSITVVSGSDYNLNIARNPTEQLCQVENASGNNVSNDIDDIDITCQALALATSCTGTADSDGDGLTDCAEFATWGTNPWLEDTDGDSYLDDEEVAIFDPLGNQFEKNPRIADMAKIAVNLTSLPNVEMVFQIDQQTTETVGTTHGQGSSTSFSKDWGGETSRQIEIGHTVSIENTTTVGVEIEISKEPSGTFKFENSLSLGFEESNSVANGSSLNWSSSEAQENSATYEESVEKSETQGVTYSGGILEVTAQVENEGNIPYDLENLSLTAFFYDPKYPFDLDPIGTLEYGSGGFPTTSILSHEESAPLNFKVDVTLDKAQRLLRDSKNIVIMPATYVLKDTNDNSILLRDEDVSERTAEVTIDYGVHAARVNKYRVAVNNGDGSKAVSLVSAFTDIMGLVISQGPGEWIYGDASSASTTPAGLLAVGSYAMDTTSNQYWLLAHNHTTESGAERTTDFYHLLNEAYDLNNIMLRARDKVSLVYVGDVDRDGLSDRMERDYGTDQAKFDTDDDTLMDAVEVYGWLTDLSGPPCDDGEMVRVYSDPLLADSDEDGIADADEKAQCENPSFDFYAIAGNDQFINVDTSMTLYGDYSSTMQISPVYSWTLIIGPDVYEGGSATGGGIATRNLTGRQPSFYVPNEVSTLVFEIEVSADGSVMSDQVTVQVQKDRSSVVYVGDNSIITPDGSTPYSTISSAIQNALGMDIYVMTMETAYTEPVNNQNGVSLFGGYDENWIRNVATNKTSIQAAVTQDNSPAVRINNISDSTWISGFNVTTSNASSDPAVNVIALKVNGGSASSASGTVVISQSSFIADNVSTGNSENPGSSYGLIANNLESLEVRDSYFRTGNAGDGAQSAAGENGVKGNDAGSFIQTGASGGLGGDGGDGGGGGTAGHGNGYPGEKGSDSPTGEIGGEGGVTIDSGFCNDGYGGKNGSNGAHGLHGVGGGLFDTAASVGFTLTRGLVGLDGNPGAGGGGGGGSTVCWFINGGAGGGGGEGGEGGKGGLGSSGGGASIGLWVDNINTVNIHDNEIIVGNGGAGGDASEGGVNGNWGAPSVGLVGANGYQGGSGGYGGYGGAGGKGGAGSGGPSIGIYATPDTSAYITNNTVTSGNGGNAGNDGHAGDGGFSYAIFDAGVGDGSDLTHSGNTLTAGTAGTAGIGSGYFNVPGSDGVYTPAAETNF